VPPVVITNDEDEDSFICDGDPAYIINAEYKVAANAELELEYIWQK
jgi:hypothetical protein